MDTGMIIGSVVALVIMAVPLVIYFRTKNRKEILTIWIDDDTVRLLLSGDDYYDFDISDIKDDREKVNLYLKEIMKKRAYELKNLVEKVQFFKDGDEKFEQELLEIIQSNK